MSRVFFDSCAADTLSISRSDFALHSRPTQSENPDMTEENLQELLINPGDSPRAATYDQGMLHIVIGITEHQLRCATSTRSRNHWQRKLDSLRAELVTE